MTGYTNPLFRVDDRLLHGSVVIGWGETLPVADFLLIDNQISNDELERELCLTCVPQDKRCHILSLEDAAEFLQKTAPGKMLMEVLRNSTTALSLYRAGVQFEQLNLGGIHHVPGSRRLLPYIFLTPQDENDLRHLMDAGVAIFCSDLPGNSRHPLEELLHE